MSQTSDDAPAWHFKKAQEGDTIRDPIQGEFFATEAIDDSAEALIREGIQNSLDARRNDEAIHIRVKISGDEKAVTADRSSFYLQGNWPHLMAAGNGLRDVPSSSSSCHYIVFEDFGTTGLEGDPRQWRKVHGAKNNFFSFFRAEGYSEKSETDRGRWGVGKTVFPRASLISSFWAVTTRASDCRSMLMGRTVLKSHDVDRNTFVPDGYFGIRCSDSHLVHPVEDPDVISNFCRLFGLTRTTEPGLSLAIPFYDREEISTASIQRAVVSGYFFPILNGSLSVEIESSDCTVVRLDKENLAHFAESDERHRPMMAVIRLAEWARDLDPSAFRILNRPAENRAPKWGPELFTPELIKAIRQDLNSGGRIAVRVPMPIREKGNPVVWSYFDVFLVADGSDKRGRPVYVRDGITISDVRGRMTHGIASVVLAVDKPVATLLGDSENPAHTQWQKDCSHYRNKYETGVANLEFVANSTAEIVRLVTESDQEEDTTVLIDLFSLPIERPEDATKARRKKPKDKTPPQVPEPPPDLPPPPPKRFRTVKVRGGFAVTKGDEGATPPELIAIEVAYDDRSSNPLNSWYPTDFDLSHKPISISVPTDADGSVKIESASGNRLLVRVLQPHFRFSVSGFDENRNLYVRAIARQEEPDGNQPI